jgi:hypothetical protein
MSGYEQFQVPGRVVGFFLKVKKLVARFFKRLDNWWALSNQNVTKIKEKSKTNYFYCFGLKYNYMLSYCPNKIRLKIGCFPQCWI